MHASVHAYQASSPAGLQVFVLHACDWCCGAGAQVRPPMSEKEAAGWVEGENVCLNSITRCARALIRQPPVPSGTYNFAIPPLPQPIDEATVASRKDQVVLLSQPPRRRRRWQAGCTPPSPLGDAHLRSSPPPRMRAHCQPRAHKFLPPKPPPPVRRRSPHQDQRRVWPPSATVRSTSSTCKRSEIAEGRRALPARASGSRGTGFSSNARS
jgi:hypothetical protein